jgi:hypothetical protein
VNGLVPVVASNAGVVERTLAPVPVLAVAPVPPYNGFREPEVMAFALVVENGTPFCVNDPVKLILLAETVPLNVGFEERATEPVPVAVVVPVPPIATATIPLVMLVPFKLVSPDPLPVIKPDAVILEVVKVPVIVGFVDRTTEPVPVAILVPVPPLATARVPVMRFRSLDPCRKQHFAHSIVEH